MAGYERDAGGEALLKDLEITEDDAENGISKSRLESMIHVFAKKRNKQYVLFHEDRLESVGRTVGSSVWPSRRPSK